MKKIFTNNKKGFTLVEMMVAISIFSVVMIIVLGTILAIIDLQRKTAALRAVQDNLGYAIETMMKDIRMGKSFTLAGESGIRFTDSNSNIVYYYLEKVVDNGKVVKSQIMKKIGVEGESIPITSEEVKITGMRFDLSGAGIGDGEQPIIILSLNGQAGAKEKYVSKIKLQTTVIQRLMDS